MGYWLLYKIIYNLPVCVYMHCTCRCGIWMCTVVSVLWQLREFVEWVGFIYLLFCDKLIWLAVYLDIYRFSQLFILCPFLHGCISLRVLYAVPYSCLLFRICAAYANVAFFDLMQRICSLCLMVMGLPDFLMHFLLYYCTLLHIFHLDFCSVFFLLIVDILYLRT